MRKIIALAAALAATGSMVMAAAPAPSQLPEIGPYRSLDSTRLYQGAPTDFQTWPGRLAGAAESTAMQGNPPDTKYFNVTDPSYIGFIPEASRNTRTAVLVVPGGGFRMLSWDSEGTRVAQWLAERGIAAFVLKYRLVQQAGPSMNMMARMAEPGLDMDVSGAPGVADASVAMRAIRARATEFNFDPNKVVAIGFSAGAHVVSHLAFADPATRPNYVAPIYGAPLGVIPSIPASTAPNALPPIFLAMAQNDNLVGPATRNFYNALYDAGYRPELHLYLNGGHGFGMNPTNNTSRHFISEFYWWMESQGLTRKPGDPDRAAPAGRGGGAPTAGAGRAGAAGAPAAGRGP